ncbi:zinc finger and SCAN domain-containing protein 25 [Ditylenchus destructor]|nr:zinc finger and SCAN domain-containing protein 25 [Ditylenchus destructor]
MGDKVQPRNTPSDFSVESLLQRRPPLSDKSNIRMAQFLPPGLKQLQCFAQPSGSITTHINATNLQYSAAVSSVSSAQHSVQIFNLQQLQLMNAIHIFGAPTLDAQIGIKSEIEPNSFPKPGPLLLNATQTNERTQSPCNKNIHSGSFSAFSAYNGSLCTPLNSSSPSSSSFGQSSSGSSRNSERNFRNNYQMLPGFVPTPFLLPPPPWLPPTNASDNINPAELRRVLPSYNPTDIRIGNTSTRGNAARLKRRNSDNNSTPMSSNVRNENSRRPSKGYFRCEQCSKVFSRLWLLTNHRRTHSEKRYACANCGRCFALKSYLSKHEDSSCGQGRLGLRARQRASGSNVTATVPHITDNQN